MSECRHCLQESHGEEFCCNGCAAAYQLIHDANLSGYYEQRVTEDSFSKPVEAVDMDFTPYISEEEGRLQAYFMVEGIHCAACVWLIEQILGKQSGIIYARVNMTTKRLKVVWDPQQLTIQQITQKVGDLGYRLMPYDPKILENQDKQKERELLLCLAVAGFVSANVMLLSVAIWAGVDMGPATLSLMQWFSALLALPGIVYAGQPFFKSALNALKHRHINMDVPISLAVILTTLISAYEMAFTSGETFFESAIMLLFFLLIGRYLEQKVQIKSRSIMESLAGLQITSATILEGDLLKAVPVKQLQVGQVLVVACGEKIAADGQVVSGTSSVDTSMLTGESIPETVTQGSFVQAGSVNTEAVLHIKITAVGKQTSLSQISELMEKSTQVKNAYTPLADRVSRLYSPVVHSLALLTLIGWMVIMDSSFHDALLYAVAVLIVTCPCAIALAVPTVAVATASNLFKQGIILKSATALERLQQVTKVVFDKTGTLTLGAQHLIQPSDDSIFKLAASLAANSKHPLSVGLVKAYAKPITPIKEVKDYPGRGLKAIYKGEELLLGSAKFCGVEGMAMQKKDNIRNQMWFRKGQKTLVCFEFEDTIRPDAKEVVNYLNEHGYQPLILSGDRQTPVSAIARDLGIKTYHFLLSPEKKHAMLEKMGKDAKVLMVGDGINDAPALAAAHVSMAPASGSDMAQVAADVVFQGKSLAAVPTAIETALKSEKVTKLNFILALGYNSIAIPLAVMGYINPLWAAVFMSASSITVMLNALRMTRRVQWRG